jgi:ubiquinone/menaquinone biosynthesis C-methylase UbiE
MKGKNKEEKIRKTMKFYDKYPIASGTFREEGSTLKMEDIQLDLKDLENKRILDCGCGPGNISLHIIKSVRKVLLISMDVSLNSLKVLKKRLRENKKEFKDIQVQGNILDIPFRKDIFDFVVAAGVVHHTPEPFKALDNLLDVLKGKGKMYLSVYNKKSFYYPEFHTIGRIFRFFYKNKMKRLHDISICLFRFMLGKINGRPISKIDAERIFADRYLTPVASFHTEEQIKKWCKRNNVKILKTGRCKLGTLIWFLVEK